MQIEKVAARYLVDDSLLKSCAIIAEYFVARRTGLLMPQPVMTYCLLPHTPLQPVQKAARTREADNGGIRAGLIHDKHR
jgi:hypothetical protein